MVSIPKIQQLISESEAGDWVGHEADYGLVDTGEGFSPTWVYEHDVKLRIERGRVAVDDFSEEWTEGFAPHSNNQSHTYWVVYGRSPVEQHVLVSVDGHRAVIPVPNRPNSDGDPWTITQYQDTLGSIVSPRYKEYRDRLEMANIEVLDH